MGILPRKQLLYLLSLVLLFFSICAEAKIVVCIPSGFPTEVEGFVRERVPPAAQNQILVNPGNGSLSDCLNSITDGDIVFIATHGDLGKIQWGGNIYDGFQGDQYLQGKNKVPLNQNFKLLSKVLISLIVCNSANDPGTPDFSIARKLLQAMGTKDENIKQTKKQEDGSIAFYYGENITTAEKIVKASDGTVSTHTQVGFKEDLSQSQEDIREAVFKILQEDMEKTSITDDPEKIANITETVKGFLKEKFPAIDSNDLFIDLLIKIGFSKEWHTHPPVNRPDSEEDNHQTAVQAIVDEYNLATGSELKAKISGKSYSIIGSPCEPEQQDKRKREDCGTTCNPESCGAYCGSVFVDIIGQADNISTLYCVHDDDLNDSQFCYGEPLPTPAIVALGPEYQNCDIEALDIQHKTDDLYAASGDDTPRKGHLYYVNKADGDIIDLGKIDCCNEVDAISFHPTSGDLWGWAQDVGLFVINPFPYPNIKWPFFPPSQPFPPHIPILPEVNIENPICLPPKSLVPTIHANVVLPKPIEVEDLTWSWTGKVLYAVENVHTHPDPDSHGDVEDLWPLPSFDFDFEESDVDNDGVEEGIRLWAYDSTNGVIREICHNLAPSIKAILGKKAEIEALESLPNNILEPPVPDNKDLLVVGFHGPLQLRYVIIETPPLPLPPQPEQLPQCKIVWKDAIPSSFNDIEGIAYSPNPKP